MTKGKWGTLINTLLRFKSDYDANAPLDRVLPSLMEAWGERYAGMGLRDLCAEMFEAMKSLRTTSLLGEAFSLLPRADMSPSLAYERLVRNEIEQVDLDACANRTLATGHRSLSSGHSAAHARRKRGRGGRPRSRLSEGAGSV